MIAIRRCSIRAEANLHVSPGRPPKAREQQQSGLKQNIPAVIQTSETRETPPKQEQEPPNKPLSVDEEKKDKSRKGWKKDLAKRAVYFSYTLTNGKKESMKKERAHIKKHKPKFNHYSKG